MNRTVQLLAGSFVAATLLTGCRGDITAPTSGSTPRFSGGSSVGGSAGGGSVTGGGGGGAPKPVCTNTLSVTATAAEALTGNSFSALYTLASCQSRTHVSLTATDLSTGAVVWSTPDVIGTTAVWTLPYNLTTYRVDATATSVSTGVVATASTVVSTMVPLACDMFVRQTVTVGYWGIYPAVWAASSAQDCGRSGTVHLRITNLNSGLAELDYPTLGTSSFIDFEGPIVSYDTPYRVDAELVSRSGEVLARSSTNIVSSPRK
jgi:hypothetical protein